MDPRSWNPARRRARARDDQTPGPGAVRPERLEQFEHPRIVGAPLPHERVGDVMLEMPVADGNRVGIGGREVGDVRRGPRADPAKTA